MPAPKLILIGPRGSGKTTIGREVARTLGLPLIDTDAEVERVAGRKIAQIFAEEAEAGFRDRETAALHGTIARDCVLATGGGIVVREENRKLLTACDCPRVLLMADAGLLAHRIANDKNSVNTRPALTHHAAAEEVAVLLERRLPWYREVATHEVDTGSDFAAAQAQVIDIVANCSSIDSPTA